MLRKYKKKPISAGLSVISDPGYHCKGRFSLDQGGFGLENTQENHIHKSMGPHGKASLSAERPRGHYSKASLIILERLQQLGGMPEDWTQGTTGQSASPPHLTSSPPRPRDPNPNPNHSHPPKEASINSWNVDCKLNYLKEFETRKDTTIVQLSQA